MTGNAGILLCVCTDPDLETDRERRGRGRLREAGEYRTGSGLTYIIINLAPHRGRKERKRYIMNMLKKKLSEKLGKNGGFTLVEMLIVVAIIAILVAVSIPLVSSALDKAREATDKANMRAAKAEATIMILNKQIDPNAEEFQNGMLYDNVEGKFVPSTEKVAGYNKMKQGSDEPDTAIIKVTDYKPSSGEFTLSWGGETAS